ncbi:hypothetical protein KXQ82_18480 [Mucilaginibacter sp. HMF5004]|uniref:hypothetical protein n=1 Tax=Mucilaginibacter rivuli TaxID=2857527 RepID=UPI001C5E472C|nr:hypothetical protein [Mucilaginibacter rivuli]MBW4891718.1 hypothetical protein [Mucilaginibacter rivuli]
MKISITICFFICAYSLSFAQTSQFRAKLNRSDEPVYLRIDQVSADIIGYDGDEIIIEAVPSVTGVKPAAAAGLDEIILPGRPKEDNIIKPSMREDTSGLSINIPPGNFSKLSIRVPKSIILFIRTDMNLINGKITVNNINSIDIEGTLASVEVHNVTNFVVQGGGWHQGSRATGKVIISDVKWTDAPVIINGEPHHRTYIVGTTNSDIELSIPADAKANFIFSSDYGKAYSNLDVKAQDVSEEFMIDYKRFYHRALALKSISLNNGKVNTIINSSYGTIYLKKE